jgi:hypothetical protein
VDGFTFQYAFANKPGVSKGLPGVSGAALYMMAVDGEAYATIKNCKFLHNTSLQDGGALYVNGFGEGSVAPVLDRCDFLFNKSLLGDGGAYVRYGGSWVDRISDIIQCSFEMNYAQVRGGAILFVDAPRSDTFDIKETIFNSNFHGEDNGLNGDAFQIIFPRDNGVTKIRLRGCKVMNHKKFNSKAAFVSSIYFSEIGNTLWDIDSVMFENKFDPIVGESLGWINY